MSGPIRTYILKEGDQLGDYTVVRPLGAGGMGEVYLVEHAHLRKQYALKILPEDVSQDATFIDRFRIEARVMADLEHPGIVRVHNFGSDKGCYFLVMDYVSGADGSPRTLDDELAWGNKLPEHVTRSLAIQICDALDYAHTYPAGSIIHRDLKPGNILIHHPGSNTTTLPDPEPDGPEPELLMKIADFGLARIVGTDYIKDVIDRSTRLTVMPMQAGDAEATEVAAGNSTISLLGTYDYMSPEQKAGEAVDARSDLYSLGLILYRMLLGHKPEGTYQPPSKSGVNKRWDPIIAKCLERNIEDRYSSAAELKKDILAITAPDRKRLIKMMGIPLAAAAVSALAVLGFSALSDSGGDDGRVESEEPIQVLESGEIAFTVNTPAPGGVLSVSKGEALIIETQTLTGVETRIPLMPGVYSFTLRQPEYRLFEQQVAIGETLPSHWAPSLIEAFGTLEFTAGEGQTLALINAAGEKEELGSPVQKEGAEGYILKPGVYEAMVTRPGYEPVSKTIEIEDNRITRLMVTLDPLPGAARVNSELEAEVWDQNTKVGTTGEWIKGLSAGAHRFELRREQYRRQFLNAEVPPDGTVEVQAEPLIEKMASLKVAVDVRKKDVPDAFIPTQGVLTIGDRALGLVDLPWTGIVKQLDQEIDIRLDVEGFSPAKSYAVTVNDYDRETVDIRLEPQPVSLTVYSSVEGEVYQMRSKQKTGGLGSLFGKDLLLGKTGEAIEIQPFSPMVITVVAEGYQPEDVELMFTAPGKQEVEVVTLKALDEAPTPY